MDSKHDVRQIVFSTKQSVGLQDYPIPDIDRDEIFSRIFALARPYTMTGKEAMYALYQAVRYVSELKIPGDFVECGVWRGGSALVAALTFRELHDPRRLWLYDTFEGMTAPTDIDVDLDGGRAADYIELYGDDGRWCYAGLDEVRSTFAGLGFEEPTVTFIKGDVLQTLPGNLPDTAAIVRLDTDWYESTRLEMELLYPRLRPGGVLIIDDYGHWEGSRRAVDEYFANGPRPLLNRTTPAVRMAVKPHI
ncbi:MAG: class I SAM-dependent methyltransferase [Burkholderiales bacterium]|nr:class I SAM-dependent methyltransferase [Burkholderiales bacterium]